MEDSNFFAIKFDKKLQIGFTKPIPRRIDKYYSNYYWNSTGFIGSIKKNVFNIFQKRRINWIKKLISNGSILDVGSGEASFGNNLSEKFKTLNIEPLGSKVKNTSVLKLDFLKWKTKKRFDCICFWESLEHTPNPQKYLEKAYKLLNKNGYVFIEFPRFNSFESKIFGKYWFHRDLPRHLSHLTDNGVKKILVNNNYTDIKIKNVLSFEYSPWGFVASLLNIFNLNITNNLKKSIFQIIVILLIPIILLSVIIEIVFFILGESPIGLVIAKK